MFVYHAFDFPWGLPLAVAVLRARYDIRFVLNWFDPGEIFPSLVRKNQPSIEQKRTTPCFVYKGNRLKPCAPPCSPPPFIA